jgi:ubiquitin-conjugating enzyme E2 variant
MTCVDKSTGQVNGNKVSAIKNWDRNKGIGEILSSLRSEMASSENRRTKQPAEGTRF